MSSIRRVGIHSLLAALMLAACAATPALAQDADPNPGAITITGAVDFTNVYMFRGIRQDDTGVITQPYFDLGLALHSADAGLKSVGINFGTWNSLHSGDAGAKSDESGLGCACGKLWYESDFYATLGLGFNGVSVGTTYTAYTSPNNGFTTVKEISFKVAGDDSAALGKFAMHPWAVLAFEVNTGEHSGQADGGLEAGKYLELGVAPGYSGARASLAVPLKFGLSMGDYYEDPVTGEDSTFGFFSIAPTVTLPFSAKPTKFGSWNLHASYEFQKLGDTTKAFNNGESTKNIALVGIGFSTKGMRGTRGAPPGAPRAATAAGILRVGSASPRTVMSQPPAASGAATPKDVAAATPARASLDAARGELRADVLRGAAGRAALERYSDRVDALLRQLYLDARPTRRPAGHRRARRLRPPAPVPPLGHRSAAALRRPDRRRRRSSSSAPSCTRCGIWRLSSATRCASSPSSSSSRSTTPNSCWRCSTRGRSPATRDAVRPVRGGVSHGRRRTRTILELAAAR